MLQSSSQHHHMLPLLACKLEPSDWSQAKTQQTIPFFFTAVVWAFFQVFSKNNPDVWSSRVLTFYQSVSSCLLSLRRNTHTGFSVDLWENIFFFFLCFFRSLNCFHTPWPWVLDAKTAVFVYIRRYFFYLKEQKKFVLVKEHIFLAILYSKLNTV